jgi:hypothetical protein
LGGLWLFLSEPLPGGFHFSGRVAPRLGELRLLLVRTVHAIYGLVIRRLLPSKGHRVTRGDPQVPLRVAAPSARRKATARALPRHWKGSRPLRTHQCPKSQTVIARVAQSVINASTRWACPTLIMTVPTLREAVPLSALLYVPSPRKNETCAISMAGNLSLARQPSPLGELGFGLVERNSCYRRCGLDLAVISRQRGSASAAARLTRSCESERTG